MKILSAKYANTDYTALHLTTADIGEALVYQEHTDQWAEVIALLQEAGITISPADTPDIKAILCTYAGGRRFQKQITGVKVNGLTVQTDAGSKAQLLEYKGAAQSDPSFSANWKLTTGTFVRWTADQIIAAANAVSAHVTACFDQEAAACAAILEGTVTTKEKVDTFFA